MKKAVALMAFCLVLMLFLTGCQDAVEVNDWSHVFVMGISKGVTDKLRFSILVPTSKNRQSTSSDADKNSNSQQQQKQSNNYTLISYDCTTLYEGIDMVETFLPQYVNFMHCKALLISETIAKDSISPFMQGMRTARQIRLGMRIIVVKGEADEFLKLFNEGLDASIPNALEGLFSAKKRTGLIEDVTYLDMLIGLKTDKIEPYCTLAAINDFSNYLPPDQKPDQNREYGTLTPGNIPRKGGSKTEFLGTAVFKDDKMVGELNADETMSLLMINGKYTNATITIEDPLKKTLNDTITIDDPVTKSLFMSIHADKKKDTEIDIDLSGEKPVIDIKVFLDATTLLQQSEFEYKKEKLKTILESAFEDYISSTVKKTVQKCQQLDSDIFGFGGMAAKQFVSISDWEKYDWQKKFKDAQVNVQTELNLRRTGTIVKNIPLDRSGE